MAFQNLRNSNQLFILHKDSVPTLEIGKVTNVSVPVPKYGNPGMYNQEMIVDITADINGTSANFQKLPAMGDIADFGNNIVVSCNKEAMNSEVSSMKQRSLDIINSIETHQSIIKGCDEILQQLNPEIIEKQRQEQENKALREEINSLKEMFKEFINTSLKQEKHATIIEIQESKFEHLSDCAEQIVKHGKKLMHCLSELESKSGEHYMERYGKRRRGGMRDSDYDDEDYPRYY